MIAIKPSGLKSWEGSITFCVCTVGFVLGLPIGTEVCVHQSDIIGMKTYGYFHNTTDADEK